MAWNSVIGQARVKDLLQRTLKNGRIAHAYLFFGPGGIGKDALALEFAKALNCERGGGEACDACPSCTQARAFKHPDIHFITALPLGKNEKQGDDPIEGFSEDQLNAYRSALMEKSLDPYAVIELEKANFIKINSIRQIKRETSLTRQGAGKKVFIVSEAQRMNADAANSLLKTLEEPPDDTVLVLTSADKDRLLPTILSRCQVVQCDALAESEIASALETRDAIAPEQAQLAAELANGSYGAARNLATGDVAKEREEVLTFLRLVLTNQRLAMAQFLDALIGEREKQGIERWLRQLAAWLREAMLFRETREHRALVSDREAQEKFTQRYANANLSLALGAVEDAIVHLHKNVYLQLIFLKLSNELRRHIAQ